VPLARRKGSPKGVPPDLAERWRQLPRRDGHGRRRRRRLPPEPSVYTRLGLPSLAHSCGDLTVDGKVDTVIVDFVVGNRKAAK